MMKNTFYNSIKIFVVRWHILEKKKKVRAGPKEAIYDLSIVHIDYTFQKKVKYPTKKGSFYRSDWSCVLPGQFLSGSLQRKGQGDPAEGKEPGHGTSENNRAIKLCGYILHCGNIDRPYFCLLIIYSLNYARI